MQNPNISNAAHLTNRSQASLLDARSLSPSIRMMQNFQDVYPSEMQAQQFYNSMPHVSESKFSKILVIKNANNHLAIALNTFEISVSEIINVKHS